MKKLISIFGALTMTATTTVMVVSCANMDNFNEIKSALDSNESLIVLISAEDCDHCKELTREMEKYNKQASTNKFQYSSFNEMFENIAKDNYNAKIELLDKKNEDEFRLTKFGEKIDKVTFKEYKAEEYKNLFEEKWLVSLKDLIRDQLRDIYHFNTEEQENKLSDKKINKIIDTNYLNSIMSGTPTFLHFRAGKFIGTTDWKYDSKEIDGIGFEESIKSYITTLTVGDPIPTSTASYGLWTDASLSETLFQKISTTSSTEE